MLFHPEFQPFGAVFRNNFLCGRHSGKFCERGETLPALIAETMSQRARFVVDCNGLDMRVLFYLLRIFIKKLSPDQIFGILDQIPRTDSYRKRLAVNTDRRGNFSRKAAMTS